ncbi:MAG: nuclear transport factor 2 family protein [Oscillatoriophycideae cyanobacterium NC_groundwater_1537_Pr4_S-0.65um_50_18]|nr:nuclear transport factor 2 family protein [Oscillatoriophycideae cyanobacterium NC_groundwater_1537_Pr4_S-0.65um_50_18]
MNNPSTHLKNSPQSSPSDNLEGAIAGISHPTVVKYFATFNAEDFRGAASLFAETGKLYPPFEAPVVGQEAIAAYLKKDAKGMKALPNHGTLQTLDGDTEAKVAGKVQTPLFSVNVSWHFVLNSQAEILTVRVKLLAALEELLHLQK